MSLDESLKSVSLAADATLAVYTGPPGVPGSASPNSGNQYRATKITGTFTVGLATADNVPVAGILHNKPQQTGSPATVAISGISPAVAGAAVTVPHEVVANASGKFIQGTGTGGGKRFFALEPAAGDNDMFTVLIVG